MQVSIEKVSDLGRKINVSIPADKINDVVSDKIKKLTKQVKLNGFRPGHVPAKLINERYGNSVRQEAVNEVIDSALNQAISEHKLSPIGDIKLENIIDESSNQGVQCVFLLEVYPEIDFNEFKDLQIKTPKVTITDADIDKSLLIVREQFGKKVAVDRPAKTGDILTVDFNGFIDGKEFDGSVGKDSQVEIGSEAYIDGFESGLIGSKTGTTKELSLKFPNDYAEKSLAGKSVIFNISIKNVEEKQLAELDEELAKALQIKDGDVSKIHPTVVANMETYIKQLTKDKEREQVINLLLTNYPVELPNSLVANEERQLQATFKHRNQEQGVVIKDLNSATIEEINIQARKNVHLSLLLREVIRNYNLKMDEKLLQQKLKQFDGLFLNAPNNKYYKNMYNNIKNSIINSTLTELALDFVMSKVAKLEESLSFEQLTKFD